MCYWCFKYEWVAPLEDKKVISIANVCQKNFKANKIRVEKGSEFYSRSIKSWLQGNYTEMYSTHNKETSIAAERFIRILRNKICNYMTSIWKNVYIVKLDYIVHKHNNAYQRIIKIKMNPADI